MKVWEVTTADGIKVIEAEKCFIGRGGTLIFLVSECITKAFSVAGWTKVELSNPERRLLLALVRDC